MDDKIKILLGGAALFFILGGPGLLKKGESDRGSTTIVLQDQALIQQTATPIPSRAEFQFSDVAPSAINSVSWLEKNGRKVVEMQEARTSYYLLARSQRCTVDSLKACVQASIAAQNIDAVEFQYTYFLDRVVLAGSGVLYWNNREYMVAYNKLRDAGWQSDERNFRNNYGCNLSFKSKNAISFITENVENEDIFIPLENAPFRNGATASGQDAISWGTISVNPRDFPLSVPKASIRKKLTDRFIARNQRPAAIRSFIVIQTKDNRLFLTEAMDTGSSVKQRHLDWRIGNTSTEIKYFFSLGSPVKATCYTFDDPSITYEQVLAHCRSSFTQK